MSMKKAVSLLVLLLLCCSMVACQKKQPIGDAPAQSDCIALANSLSDSLTLRKYPDLIALFDDAMKEALPEEALKEAWLGVAGQIGKFEKITKSAYNPSQEKEGVYTVVDTLKFTNRSVAVTYSFTGDLKLTGLWFTYTSELPTPVSTDAFSEENITVTTKDYKMNGLLTLPKGVEKPPVCILVHGSGSTDLNETIGENQPFLDLAHGLAEQGVAVLRYDKRYYALPERIVADAVDMTIHDEVLDDVASAIALAKADKRLDPGKIYVLGHSLGGMLTPKIATDNKDVAGIISMAGSLRKMQDIVLMQNEEVIATAGLTKEEATLQLETLHAFIEQANNATADQSELIAGYPGSYWHSMNILDSAALAKALTLPILVLQGSADFQISPTQDFPLWAQTLGKRDNVVYKEYEGLNHLMMPTNGKRDASEYATPGKLSPTVITDIATFILQ